MITDQEVMRILERADPASEDDDSPMIDAAGYLDALRTRSVNVTIIDTEPTSTRPPRRRWPIIVAAAGAVMTVAIGGLVARVGFIGLPPEGATHSTSETGELVVRRYGGNTAGTRSRVWVFADGRLIWQQDGYRAEGANDWSTGYLEQRLTPEGVENIRSEVLALRLSGEDLKVSVDDRRPCVAGAWMLVPDRERLVRVVSGCAAEEHPDLQAATEDQTTAILRLDELLRDLQSWPASWWQDQTIRAYVPSGYGICLHPSDPNEIGPISTVPGEPGPQPSSAQPSEQLLSLLPAPAAEVLHGSETVPDEAGQQCLAVTTDEARLLDQALTDQGAESDLIEGRHVLAYHLDDPGQDGTGVRIIFEPRLPDGSINCSTCG